MLFILTENQAEASQAVAGRLIKELGDGRRVLWLTSGGSQTGANVDIMAQIPDEISQNLTLMPIDERYGPPGHDDSNWQQLMAAGFRAKQAKLLPVLRAGLDFDQTAAAYNQMAEQAFKDNDIIIGCLGIGPDGHTAGILPNSIATSEESDMVAHYLAPPYQRLTLSFKALRQINAAYVLVFGAAKNEALKNLKTNLPLNRQPAQILKDIPETYVYNDQVGED